MIISCAYNLSAAIEEMKLFWKRSNPKKILDEQLSLVGNEKLVAENQELARYERDRNTLIMGLSGSEVWPFGKDYPILHEWDHQAGAASGHYFHQDLWAAQSIFKRNPVKHIDVGSRIDGFVAHVAAFRCIEIYDIRPLEVSISNVTFVRHDFMEMSPTEICDSLSCLHALEHFGLGRYGDPVDAYGYSGGFKNISSMLKSGGNFYFSVPIGAQRIEFNAHRVFGIETLFDLFEENKMEIAEFSYVDDNGAMHKDHTLKADEICNSLGLHYGCGLFDLRKK